MHLNFLRLPKSTAVCLSILSWLFIVGCCSAELSFAEQPARSGETLLAERGKVVDQDRQAALELYQKKLLPILKRDCFECHSKVEDRFESGLSVETRQGLIDGGDRGSAFDFDDPKQSLLLSVLSYEDEELQMPPNGRLSDKEIAAFKMWIEQRAPTRPEDLDKSH